MDTFMQKIGDFTVGAALAVGGWCVVYCLIRLIDWGIDKARAKWPPY